MKKINIYNKIYKIIFRWNRWKVKATRVLF